MLDSAREQKPKTNAEKLETLCKKWNDYARNVDPLTQDFCGDDKDFAKWDATAETMRSCAHELSILIREMVGLDE